MKEFFKGLLKAYAILAAYAVALAAIIVAALFWKGAVTGERVQAAFQALRASAPARDPEAAKRPAGGIAEREQIVENRTLELQKLEDRTVSRLSQLRAEQQALDAKVKEAAVAAAEAKKAQEDYAQAKSDAELSANVPILSRMEAPGIVSVLKSGDDARFVRYLRALRPGKAAEVLEALRTDPQFEEEFRRLPFEAPPGTKTRAERLNEEFKKAP
jgi:hypothetical protein